MRRVDQKTPVDFNARPALFQQVGDRSGFRRGENRSPASLVHRSDQMQQLDRRTAQRRLVREEENARMSCRSWLRISFHRAGVEAIASISGDVAGWRSAGRE